MKNTQISLIALLVMFFTLVSCEEVIDIAPQDSVTEVAVYAEIDQAERALFPLYNSTEGWGMRRSQFWGHRTNLESASFEGKFNFRDLNNIYNLRDGGWSAGNVGLNFQRKWLNYYAFVQEINLFLFNIEGSAAQEEDTAKAEILIAEARFLRANVYRKLINYFGGVPIFDTPNQLSDDFEFTRNTYEECVNFIVSELDAVIPVLPDTRPNAEFGRATSLAAMAVKSRTLLYAASDLHDPALLPQATNQSMYSYAVATKWADAEKAAKDVIDVIGDNSLIQVADAKEYQEMFLSPNANIIFARPYADGVYEVGTGGFAAANSLPDQAFSPSGYGGWGLCSPTHNYTLEYNFADGTTTGGITPVDPNANREMRYYANLNFQGALFRGLPVDYALSNATDMDLFPDGKDSPNGLGNVLHSSKTGYNIRKFQDESLGSTGEISPNRPYILFRYAEVYLNYAEALAEQGKDALASTFLSKVSERGLQPAIVATGQNLIEAIKRERRVELSFEGHNFFDERRWLNSDNLGFDIQGLRWTKGTDGSLTFDEYTVINRPWFDRMYYLPIPDGEVERVPTLLQNDGY